MSWGNEEWLEFFSATPPTTKRIFLDMSGFEEEARRILEFPPDTVIDAEEKP